MHSFVQIAIFPKNATKSVATQGEKYSVTVILYAAIARSIYLDSIYLDWLWSSLRCSHSDSAISITHYDIHLCCMTSWPPTKVIAHCIFSPFSFSHRSVKLLACPAAVTVHGIQKRQTGKIDIITRRSNKAPQGEEISVHVQLQSKDVEFMRLYCSEWLGIITHHSFNCRMERWERCRYST